MSKDYTVDVDLKDLLDNEEEYEVVADLDEFLLDLDFEEEELDGYYIIKSRDPNKE